MRKRFVLTATLVLISTVSVIGCSSHFSSVQPAEADGQSRAIINPAELPRINPALINMSLSPRDRARAIVLGTAGQLPHGTRLYVSDVILVRDGNEVTLPSRSQTVSKRPDGRIVLLNPQGRVVQIFPVSAVIQIQKDAQVQAVLPGRPLPMKYEHSTPFEVIK